MFASVLAQSGVRLPGDRRPAKRRAHEADGVAVPVSPLAQLETPATGQRLAIRDPGS